MSKIDIHKLIDDAIAKKDRYVSLYIGPQGDISIEICPICSKEVHSESRKPI